MYLIFNRVRVLVRGLVKFQSAVAYLVRPGFARTFHQTKYQKPCAIEKPTYNVNDVWERHPKTLATGKGLRTNGLQQLFLIREISNDYFRREAQRARTQLHIKPIYLICFSPCGRQSRFITQFIILRLNGPLLKLDLSNWGKQLGWDGGKSRSRHTFPFVQHSEAFA